MNYTVVLLQPVPEQERPALQTRLSEAFSLSEDQAGKLSQRRAGRLMKPTSRERAERLLGIYRELGLAVRLEEVSAPTPAPAAAPPAAPTPPAPVAASPVLVVTPTPEPTLPATEPTAPAAVPDPAPAAVPTAAPDGWDDLSGATPASTSPASRPAAPAAAAGGWEDFATSLGGPSPDAQPGTAPEAAGTRLGRGGVREDRDLTIVPETAAAGAAAAPAVGSPARSGTPVAVSRAAAPAGGDGPRAPLARRLLLTALLPPLLAGLTFLLAISVLVPPAITGTAREGARATATGVGATVDTTDLARAYSQMEEIVAQPAVDFISYLNPGGRELLVIDPDGLPQTPDAFSTVYDLRANEVRTALEENGQEAFGIELGGTLRRDLDEQLGLLGQGLDASDPLIQELRQARRELPGGRRVEVVQLRVFEVQGPDGSPQRLVVSPAEAANVQGQEVAQVAVGLVAEESRRLLGNLQAVLTVLLLLTLAAIAFFAARLVRRIVEPLERLATAADAISMGELDTPVLPERNDEIGDLARSLERMRLSLQAAMSRLRRRR